MDQSDVLLLARAQFGLNIAFHILFPSLTIALGWILLYFRIRYARSGDPAWLATYKLWTKVFALSFAMGVVSGITMSFQFGTNWPGYMQRVGNIAGPLLAYEVLTAFFLEATFLGVMLFGMNRVPGWVHVFSAAMVAVGTTISAFWILALNSWMHTPAGHVMDGSQIIAGEWLQVIFNPSFPYRFTHMLLASGLTASFVIAGLSAWRLLRAGGAGVLRVPGDGGDGGADAARGVERRVGDAPGHAAATMDAVGFLGFHFRGMDRDARGLARHRDRQAALARDRDSQDPRRRGRSLRRAARGEPHRLHHYVYSDADRVPGGAHAPRGQRRQGVSLDLPLVFAALMGLAILMYVVLDGYDLGVGMLMPAADEREQDLMVASIGPFWDANETWLVLGVGILLVAFPAAQIGRASCRERV